MPDSHSARGSARAVSPIAPLRMLTEVMPTWTVEKKLEGSWCRESAALAPGLPSSARCWSFDLRDETMAIRFVDLTDEGDPAELARRYAEAGADEICFLDITAAPEGRGTLLDIVERTASQVFVPLSVGGGVRSALEMRDVLRAGADKVAINTAAVDDPELVRTCARRFGSQCVVISVDARAVPGEPGRWRSWCRAAGSRPGPGCGRMDRAVRGQRCGRSATHLHRPRRHTGGLRHPLLQTVTSRVHVPVIASGGAGSPADMTAAVAEGHADAVLAASIFHRDIHSIAAVKADMAAAGVAVRLTEDVA